MIPKPFSTVLSTLLLAAKRLWNQRLLMFCLLAGLLAAVGLLASIPLYADAVQNNLMQGELTEEGTRRPPFAFLWRYVGAWHGPVEWDDYAGVDEYVSSQIPRETGLPLTFQVRHVRTGNLRLLPPATAAVRQPMLWTSLAFITGLQEHIQVVDGAFPGAREPGQAVDVLVSQALADKMGLQVGESYAVQGSKGKKLQEIPVRIAGVWQPRDPTEPFWFYSPQSFEDVLLTSEPAFRTQVVPALDQPISTAVWYQVFNGSGVRASGIDGLLKRIFTAQWRAAALLPYTSLDVSPTEALQNYSRSAQLLTATLALSSIPVVGVVVYFLGLIAGMVVQRDQGEIAVLRSRGTTRGQVLALYLLEGVIAGAAGLAGGLFLAVVLARWIGRTRTFLDSALFGKAPGEPLQIVLSPTALGYGLLAVGLAVLVVLVQALGASRYTIVTYKWERSRALVGPLWQRGFFDLLLLVPLGYGWYLLRRQGTVAAGGDPFANPLLFLVPALFCFSLSLLFVRLFPWLMRALAWLANWLPGTAPILALRQLARATGQYGGPLLLLSLTVSLAVLTASMAATLDGHLKEEVYYQVGADLKLVEPGESNPEVQQREMPGEVPAAPSEETGPRWFFLPISEHLTVPGVRAAARVGHFAATAEAGNRRETVQLLGIDRTDFPTVAFFRPDFAGGESLGGLMNRLAADPAALLVSRDFLTRQNLALGEPLRLQVSAGGMSAEIDFVIAGVLDRFPSLYPQDGPFFVANLEYLYEGLGDVVPYDAWLATDPAASPDEIVAGVRAMGVAVLSASDARTMITDEQTRPERQGLFGLLSAGFLAAAALTVLGFLVYAVFSFRRRFIELGVLRAVGLSVGQMAGYLAGEQALLIVAGAGLGTGLGVWASRLFVPYLQVETGKAALVVPFVVQVAWGKLWAIDAVLGAMFVVAVLALVGLLIRMKVFEVVKMGEAG